MASFSCTHNMLSLSHTGPFNSSVDGLLFHFPSSSFRSHPISHSAIGFGDVIEFTCIILKHRVCAGGSLGTYL